MQYLFQEAKEGRKVLRCPVYALTSQDFVGRDTSAWLVLKLVLTQ